MQQMARLEASSLKIESGVFLRMIEEECELLSFFFGFRHESFERAFGSLKEMSG
jgi:hypothetical protein